MDKLILSMIATVLLAACATNTEPVFPDRQPTPIDAATTGSISGVVTFTGTPPAAEKIGMGGFPGCVHGGGDNPVAERVAVRDGKLMNVFVYIKSGLEGKTFAIPREPVIFDQKGCIYTPHVVGLQRYQPLKVLNSDSLLHNVHSLPVKNKSFNFGMAVAGLQQTVQFENEEVMVRIKCDVHGWMEAFVGVVDHPYFAVTGGDGSFNLKGVPPGNYVVEAWHEVYGTQTAAVTLGEKGEATASFSFAPK